MNEAMLNEYARLIVRVGVNLQKGQPAVINAPIECADFARRIAKEAFEAGAKDAVIQWGDEKFAHLRFKKAPSEAFDNFPEWRKKFCDDMAADDAVFISIHADNPEIFKDVEPDRLQRSQKAAGEALLEYRARLMSNKNAWCVVSIPTEDWAKKIFPDKSAKEAVGALWEEIFRTVRIDGSGDAVEKWRKHTAFLAKAADFMNRNAFHALHYTNSMGTDLTVGLPEGHIWAGGAEDTQSGTSFVANMPTEEIYTLPDRDRVDGVVYATKPLVFNGNLIEGMCLTFKDGKVTDYDAAKGKEILKELLTTDEGALHLGECALVPFDSPISNSGILFYNTLFDENAACHLALGKAYPTCIKGGAEMNSVELLQHGVNDSILHEDFMIGSEDMNITGITKDGKEIPVFRNGNFVEF
ncbi:aminopeptidase [Schwartzia sp. (in: firmicutes)]|nr:aminopeptidase [Schwartzia sp. (in: firmicutes)]